jgi:N-carbamoyl-L-amino-acid hydrolase
VSAEEPITAEPIAEEPITAAELAALMRELLPIGLDADGATTRLAWTAEEEHARRWFGARARELGRQVERDPAGNLWAVPDGPPPWWAVGSHLDSVLAGGRYDGALGVVVAFAVAAREPVAVIAFADEEGARFNTPTFGSRALLGRLDVEDAMQRSDAAGERLRDAFLAAGLDPDELASAPDGLARMRGLLELHIDQTREVAHTNAPVAIVSGLAARMRTQVLVQGRADHAGTTQRDERHDALAAAARVIVRGDELSASTGGMLFTAARIEVEPNAPSTVPERVRLWLDARAPEAEKIESWRDRLEDSARAIARECGVTVELRTAAMSVGTQMSEHVREVLRDSAASAAGVASAQEILCWAGHDAGVLAQAVPTGMVLVRNPTGISHAPEEDVSLEDAAVGANVILRAVRALT